MATSIKGKYVYTQIKEMALFKLEQIFEMKMDTFHFSNSD